MDQVTQAALATLRDIIAASAGSDPDFDTNRKLKKEWADKLTEILKTDDTRKE